ncbi:asparagine synthase [Bellilinea caldifistulae]|nr:asparagine synthase [Bellilinea caldifistulae]
MILALHHRGPDEFGIYRDEQTGLSSARLSIIDLAGGSQPISNEDDTIWIVFNGEIFNYVELRPPLEQKGHRFKTKTDTEVIVHLYEEYGTDCLNFLNGQFAIAIWDSRTKTLLLARDRLGIRPLFYTCDSTTLMFASEIKSFLAVPGFHLELDKHALSQVFTYWAVQPPRTSFENVKQIPPGHFLLYRENKMIIEPYWQLSFQAEDHQSLIGETEVFEQFVDLLIDATQIRLRADVPVGAYLSGGLDSSTIAAIIRKYTETPLDSFSIAFSNEEFNESDFQQEMARYLGTRHQVVQCTPEDIGRVFPDVIWHTESPVLRTSPAPMFLLSRLVQEHGYKVVLTGEGADEFLAGYDIFKEMKIRRFVARDPASAFRPLLFKKLYPDIPRLRGSADFLMAFFQRKLMETDSPFYSHLIRWENTARSLRFLKDPLTESMNYDEIHLPVDFEQWSHLAQAQYLEVVTFMSPYLLSSQGDRPAMAHSVEGRFPFLDYRLVEFCNRLPDGYKLRGLNEKYLLRKFASGFLPPEIWKRKKKPYRAPIKSSFFSNHQPEYLADLVSEENLQKSDLFNKLAVKKLFLKASNENQLSEIEEMVVVGIISTLLLFDQFILRNGSLNQTTSAPIKIIDKIQN